MGNSNQILLVASGHSPAGVGALDWRGGVGRCSRTSGDRASRRCTGCCGGSTSSRWNSWRDSGSSRCRWLDSRTGAVLTDETAYAVTSLTLAQASPAALLRHWRTHWGIENGLHWLRDVVFAEDASTTRTAHATQAVAALRNLALSLLHRWRHRRTTAARQFYAAHPATLFRRLDLTARRL